MLYPFVSSIVGIPMCCGARGAHGYQENLYRGLLGPLYDHGRQLVANTNKPHVIYISKASSFASNKNQWMIQHGSYWVCTVIFPRVCKSITYMKCICDIIDKLSIIISYRKNRAGALVIPNFSTLLSRIPHSLVRIRRL